MAPACRIRGPETRSRDQVATRRAPRPRPGSSLTAFRDGNLEPIVEEFAAAAERSVANATMLHDDVEAVRAEILACGSRRTRSLELMASLCCTEPAFTAQMAVASGITRPTAYRLCERLTGAGILRREGSIRGRDVWSVRGLTDALDQFAVRAGRRRTGR